MWKKKFSNLIFRVFWGSITKWKLATVVLCAYVLDTPALEQAKVWILDCKDVFALDRSSWNVYHPRIKAVLPNDMTTADPRCCSWQAVKGRLTGREPLSQWLTPALYKNDICCMDFCPSERVTHTVCAPVTLPHRWKPHREVGTHRLTKNSPLPSACFIVSVAMLSDKVE